MKRMKRSELRRLDEVEVDGDGAMKRQGGSLNL